MNWDGAIRIIENLRREYEEATTTSPHERAICDVLPQRIVNALEKYHQVLFVKQLMALGEVDVIATRTMNASSVDTIKRELRKIGLNWPRKKRR